MNKSSKIRAAAVFPEDALAVHHAKVDAIDGRNIDSIPALFEQRVRRSPEKTAYCQFDPVREEWIEHTWQDMAEAVNHWRRAIAAEGLLPGERAAIRMSNSTEWVLFDQSALAQGLVVVPVYVEDRADNIAYILEHTGARLLLLENYSQWSELSGHTALVAVIKRVVVVNDENDEIERCGDARVMLLDHWLASAVSGPLPTVGINRNDLATIVYTSGTTGRPKGVMLSHGNMLANAYGGLQSVAVFPTDRLLSFLPLSHMFERTVGYYLTMMAGASVTFSRSIPQLLDDMAETRPTVMIIVPRIFEKAYSNIKTRLDDGPGIRKWLFQQAVDVGWKRFEHRQGRGNWHFKQCFWPIFRALVANKVVQRFGGELRFVVCGGARLAPTIARVFVGLGIEILQGYGLTESSPILTANTPNQNKPSSIGLPLRGAELRLGDNDELQARGPFVMLGYWKNPEATQRSIDPDGWLLTGDIASICEQGFISITGRIKEIIVLANGEKVPPADMESAICEDPLFEQAMVVGEGQACLAALVVPSPDRWPRTARSLGVNPADRAALQSDKVKQFVLDRIAAQLHQFPGYAFIRYVTITTDVWCVDDGSITPTLKLKRPVLMERFKQQISAMYMPPKA